jgi:predicted RNA-binding Zn-ribbon protein involved in translation (DUF1610 family)
LYVEGWGEEELADLIGVHPARMPVILEDAMREVRARTRDLAGVTTRLLLEALDSFIAENVPIVVTRCPACGGEEQARISCRKCRWPGTAYGPTGYAYPPSRRRAAVSRINQLAWRRIKLLGLDKPPPSSATGSPRHREPSGPIAEYLGQSLAKKLPGVELEDAMAVELRGFALDRELLLLDMLMREAAHFLLRECIACGGDKSQRTQCDTCGRTGYFYDPATRVKAVRSSGRVQEQRIKLLGLDKQQLHWRASDPASVAFLRWLQKASDEELEAELEKLSAGSEDKATNE